MSQTVLIGGGAAGLCCAGFLGQQGIPAVILDRNARPGRKLLITGKGRCNLTNDCSPEEFLENVRTNPRFLYSAARAFPPAQAKALFEELGVPLKTERGKRVFPVSDQAADIVQALRKFAGQARFLAKSPAEEILVQDGHVSGVRLADGQVLPARQVLLATGGCSYPLTGSDGGGYRLAQRLGHTIQPPRPSLAPVATKEKWCAELMGLSLRNVQLCLKDNKNKVLFKELGEMLFTHFGVSGPLVLSASAYMKEECSRYRLSIDLKPGLDEMQLDARILRDFSQAKNKDFANALGQLLPRKLIPVAVRLSGIPAGQKVNSITREQRRAFCSLLKSLPLTPVKVGPMEEAIITSGGICVKEVDPGTMESKLVKGLYFAGEVLDVDAFTGGFNLQIAWATAFLAAKAMAKERKEDGI